MNRNEMYADGESWKTGSAAKRERIEAYVEWLIIPKDEREPNTKKEFAAMMGITVQTLANYERDSLFQRLLHERMRGSFKAARMPDVIETLIQVATDMNNKNVVAAARLLLDWSERAGKEDAQDLSALSTDRLMEIINNDVAKS